MKTFKVVVFIFIVGFNYVLGSPKQSKPTEIVIDKNLQNFKPIENLSDETFVFANPMKFDSIINHLNTLIKSGSKHMSWLIGIIKMAKSNKNYASALSFKLLPMDKDTFNKLKAQHLPNLQQNISFYENHAKNTRNQLKTLIESTLFYPFSIDDINKLIKFHGKDDKKMAEKCATQIDEDRSAFQKDIKKFTKQYKKHFSTSKWFFKKTPSQDKCIEYLNQCCRLYQNNKVQGDFNELKNLFEKLRDRQVKFIKSIEDELKT